MIMSRLAFAFLGALAVSACGAKSDDAAAATQTSGGTTKSEAAPASKRDTAAGAATAPATSKAPATTAAGTPKPGQPASRTPTASPSVAEGLQREVFNYGGAGRRDPFVSLMKSNDLRPTMADLTLIGVLVDPSGRNSVAIMRDLLTKEQYRVRVGATLGRMRVTRITSKAVTFNIEEFGRNRQEELAYSDSTRKRTP